MRFTESQINGKDDLQLAAAVLQALREEYIENTGRPKSQVAHRLGDAVRTLKRMRYKMANTPGHSWEITFTDAHGVACSPRSLDDEELARVAQQVGLGHVCGYWSEPVFGCEQQDEDPEDEVREVYSGA